MSEINDLVDWTLKGRIELIAEKLVASGLTHDPGLYCIVFKDNTRYYGEAGDIDRRIGDYLLYYASTGIESEFRVNKALHASGGADVYTQTGDRFSDKSKRCVLEHQAQEAAKQHGVRLVNGGSLLARIAFHGAEVQRITEQLMKKEQARGGQA